MVTLPALKDVIPAEQLEELREKTAASAEAALENDVFPLIKRHAGFTGEVHPKVSVEFEVVMSEDKAVIHNKMQVELVFVPAQTFDLFEEVQRTLFSTMFKVLLDNR
jgi:hypothetical protein